MTFRLIIISKMKDRIKEEIEKRFNSFLCQDVDFYGNGIKKQGFVFEVDGSKDDAESVALGITKSTGASVKIQQLNTEGK